MGRGWSPRQKAKEQARQALARDFMVIDREAKEELYSM